MGGKKSGTTSSRRKFVYRSFRDRVDSIKIDPIRDLARKPFEDTDDSFFLSALLHYIEINLSKNFQEFSEKVEPISRSLPQIIYNQNAIFDALEKAILVNDSLSLQPLLDLLSQFCHDLGPDFMPFYVRTLDDIIKVAIPQTNPDSLELIFNALAYIFKYLSKIIVKDILPTFKRLSPLLLLEHKGYITKFASQALSFLVRKSHSDSLNKFISYSLDSNSNIEGNKESYHTALVIIYSEALLSVSGTLFSRARIIVENFASYALLQPSSESILADVSMNVLSNCLSAEQASPLYEGILSAIKTDSKPEVTQAHPSVPISIIQILHTLAFAEAGRKVSSWSQIMEAFRQTLKLELEYNGEEKNTNLMPFNHSVVQLAATMMRNADEDFIKDDGKELFKLMLNVNKGKTFLPFLDLLTDLSVDKAMLFANQFFTLFIVKNWKEYYREIGYFLSRMKDKGLVNSDNDNDNLMVRIPTEFLNFIVKGFKKSTRLLEDSSEGSMKPEDYIDILWEIQIVENSKAQVKTSVLLSLLRNLQITCSSLYASDLIGHVLLAISHQKINDEEALAIVRGCTDIMENSCKSLSFLEGYCVLLESIHSKSWSKASEYVSSNKDKVLLYLSQNMRSPNHSVRNLSLKAATATYNASGLSVPDPINSCQIIEGIPLDIQHGREIQLRLRKLGRQLSSEPNNDLLNRMMSDFAIGQLSVRFSPTWQGVFDFIAPTVDRLSEYLWKNVLTMISTDYDELEEIQYFDYAEATELKSSLLRWYPQTLRLSSKLEDAESLILKYDQPIRSVFELEKTKAPDLRPTMFYRLQAIKLLNKFSDIAENHFTELYPFIKSLDRNVTDEHNLLAGWTKHDMNELVSVLTHFKHLEKVQGIDHVKEILFQLLMSKLDSEQKLSLQCLLNLKDATYNKYQNELESLLDNTLFRDTVVRFLQGDSMTLSEEDVPTIMPLVIRILFGRSLIAATNGTNRGRKNAAITAVNSLKPLYITQFLELSFVSLDFSEFFGSDKSIKLESIDKRLLRNINGFLHTASTITQSLKLLHIECFEVLIRPLIYSLTVSEIVISSDGEEFMIDDVLNKIAHNNRKLGFKLLYKITDYLGEDFNWMPYGNLIYSKLIRHQLANFAQENLEGVSSLMMIMTTLWPQKNLQFLLYYDDFLPTKSLLALLENKGAKEGVILSVLKFIDRLIQDKSQDNTFLNLLSVVIDSCMRSILSILSKPVNKEVSNIAIRLLLSFVSDGFISDNEMRKNLIPLLMNTLTKPDKQVDLGLKRSVTSLLDMLVKDYECSMDEIIPLYKSVSELAETASDQKLRLTMSGVFKQLADKFTEFEKVGNLMVELNSYSERKILEPDYERRLDAFQIINEKEYPNLSALEWLPIVHTSLYLMKNEDDLAMRSSATYTLTRFVDCFSAKKNQADASPYLEIMDDIIIPRIKTGVREKNENIRRGYVKLINHTVQHAKYFHDFSDMKILVPEREGTNFFDDITHLQMYKRQKAVRNLALISGEFTSASIAHYLLPIIEHYAFWTEEKFRNLANDTVDSMEPLLSRLTWHQFRAIFVRYLKIMNSAMIKDDPEKLRDTVLMIVAASRAFNSWSIPDAKRPHDYPKEDILCRFVIEQTLPQLKRCLNVRNADTMVKKIPVSEAMISLIMCCPKERIDAELPGILTGVCQILRSRSEEIRDAVRKHLGRIAKSLGSKFLNFIFRELKGALTRGPQIHILSFTIHYLLVIMENEINHGDLVESADLIVESIMNDIFGAASEEKAATGYSNKTKEIKHNKSYDTGELLAENIYLKNFLHLLKPIKFLLGEKLTLKAQTRLDELLRRFAVGLMKNEESKTKDILVLCFEIYQDSEDIVEKSMRKPEKTVDEKEDHFLVHLDSKPQKTKIEYSVYIKTMQKFSFELLRSAITRHKDELLKPGYLKDFIPILVTSLNSDDEGVICTSLRVLTVLVKVDFPEDVNPMFVSASRSVLKILQDVPGTDSELAQRCLKFLSTTIRYRDDLKIKPMALAYILKELMPDLDEPQREGVAFGFLKSIISRHYMLPELYDVVDRISRLMVTSTSKEIRQASRTVFYTFLMEYDQGRGRLDKELKLLVNNLSYPAETGRKSVMELLNLLVTKCNKQLLEKLVPSLFLALSRVAVVDNSPSCREIASALLSSMFTRMSKLECSFKFVTDLIVAWISQPANPVLVRCGLNAYESYVTALGIDENQELNKLAMERVLEVLKSVKRTDAQQSQNDNIDWEIIYAVMSTFEAVLETSIANVTRSLRDAEIWKYIIEALLYPHSWIRAAASRLISSLLLEIENDRQAVQFEVSDEEIQTIAYRSFRQLGAPQVQSDLASQAIKNIAIISRIWEKANTPFISAAFTKHNDGKDAANEEKHEVKTYDSPLEWAINRSAAILRNESRGNSQTLVAKKALIRYYTFISKFVDSKRLGEILSEQVLIPLVNISEEEVAYEDDEDNSLPLLATQCLENIRTKLGTSSYNIVYSSAKQIIETRRADRKTKRAQLELMNPKVAAKRRLKKHMRFRKKRRMNKDENGLYKAKRKRRV